MPNVIVDTSPIQYLSRVDTFQLFKVKEGKLINET